MIKRCLTIQIVSLTALNAKLPQPLIKQENIDTILLMIQIYIIKRNQFCKFDSIYFLSYNDNYDSNECFLFLSNRRLSVCLSACMQTSHIFVFFSELLFNLVSLNLTRSIPG